jgi:hypothetical protein
MGIGGRLVVDEAAYIKRFSSQLAFSYRVKLAQEQKLVSWLNQLKRQNLRLKKK